MPADAFFLIHIENQSYSQAEFGRRMFQYFARLYEKHGLPVYPIAVFSYDTPLRPEPERFTVSFPDLPVVDFRFRVVQLNRLSWRDFVNTPNPVASALMAKMQIAPADRWRVKWECLRLLATLRLDRARMRLISGFVDQYLRLSREENARFVQRMQAAQLTEAEAQVLEISTSWKEEGIEEGLLQGREEGQEQVVVRLLTRKCGPLAEETEARVRDLPPDRLLELADALLDFSGMADLLNFLNEPQP